MSIFCSVDPTNSREIQSNTEMQKPDLLPNYFPQTNPTLDCIWNSNGPLTFNFKHFWPKQKHSMKDSCNQRKHFH